MRTKLKLVSAIGALVLAGSIGLAGCSSNKPADSATEQAEDSGAGFQEYPVGDDQPAPGNNGVNELNVSVVYFQPVDMEPAGAAGLKASEASFHMEVDVSALKDNTLGYGAGDFVPGLKIDYKIALKDGSGTPVTGTFMKMNASDGPHYGANIKLDQAGDYTVSVSIHSPEEDGWVLHVDPETGVKGRFWTQPIELQWDWKYTPQQW